MPLENPLKSSRPNANKCERSRGVHAKRCQNYSVKYIELNDSTVYCNYQNQFKGEVMEAENVDFEFTELRL